MMHSTRSTTVRVLADLALTALLLACAGLAAAELSPQHAHGESQPYRGLQTRSVASMSASDIEQIENGSGWGLALPAELNGYPGPRHVLDLADELGLSRQQSDQTRKVFEQMRAEAVKIGAAFIAAERALTRAFGDRQVDAGRLDELLNEAALQRRRLRYTHLAAHLEMARILTDDQIRRYDMLRGYDNDPCRAVPEGHNPIMWRKHNGCDASPPSTGTGDTGGHGVSLETPEDYRVRGAELAMRTKSVLGSNLMRALRDNGAPGAINFCNTKAVKITSESTPEAGASVERVSDRPRNPDNAADALEIETINTFRAALAQGRPLQPILHEAGNAIIGHYPIVTNSMCLQCHGSTDSDINTATRAAIDAAYPNDRATGYGVNQLRGLFVVTMDRDQD